MNTKRKITALILSFALAFTLCFTFAPVKAQASEPYTLTFYHEGRLWDYETEDGAGSLNLHGLYEKGNYFMLEYDNGTEDEFDYVESEGAFYQDPEEGIEGDPIQIEVYKDSGDEVYYGENEATLGFYYRDEYYETTVKFRGVRRVNVDFSKHKFNYDGKVHTPSYKLRLDDSSKKVLPASDYKATWDKGRKNVGVYKLTAKLNTSKDYPDTTFGVIEIYPTKPVITKVKAGKKKATIKWKKFTKAQQKQIKRFVIEYSTDKNFKKNVKKVTVNKKKASKTIRKLKRKKTYYFRVRAIGDPAKKSVTWLNSKSKVKKAKIK